MHKLGIKNWINTNKWMLTKLWLVLVFFNVLLQFDSVEQLAKSQRKAQPVTVAQQLKCTIQAKFCNEKEADRAVSYLNILPSATIDSERFNLKFLFHHAEITPTSKAQFVSTKAYFYSQKYFLKLNSGLSPPA